MDNAHEDNDDKASGGALAGIRSGISRLFESCEGDPKGSVHRAWGITLVFVALFFVMAIVEIFNLQRNEGSKALIIAATWTALIHLILAILGTFVLKRFPTSFSIGFFLGLLLVVANQNLILFATFINYNHGTPSTNHTFANLAFTLCLVFGFFGLILGQFRDSVIIAAVDAKNLASAGNSTVDERALGDGEPNYARQ